MAFAIGNKGINIAFRDVGQSDVSQANVQAFSEDFVDNILIDVHIHFEVHKIYEISLINDGHYYNGFHFGGMAGQMDDCLDKGLIDIKDVEGYDNNKTDY